MEVCVRKSLGAALRGHRTHFPDDSSTPLVITSTVKLPKGARALTARSNIQH